jgi:hypothetical protein
VLGDAALRAEAAGPGVEVEPPALAPTRSR